MLTNYVYATWWEYCKYLQYSIINQGSQENGDKISQIIKFEREYTVNQMKKHIINKTYYEKILSSFIDP